MSPLTRSQLPGGRLHASWDKQIDRTAVERGVFGHFAVNAPVTREADLLGGICSVWIALSRAARVSAEEGITHRGAAASDGEDILPGTLSPSVTSPA